MKPRSAPSPSTGLLLAALLAAAADAGTWSVDPRPFAVTAKIDATVVPSAPVQFSVEAAEWEDFTIEKITPHATTVKKGETVVAFKREALERKLDDARRGAKQAALAAADARSAHVALAAGVELKLEAAKRNHAQAAEDLAYFLQTKRPLEEEGANEKVKRATQSLEAEREELKQLLAMYEADDLTETTEEFILKRQRDAVASAEFMLKSQKLATARALEVDLPREQLTLEKAAKEAKIALTQAGEELPRSVEASKLAVAAAEAAAKRAADDLAKLEADATLLELKAPAAGVFYHGAFEDGRWLAGEATKGLLKGGKVPPRRPFAALVPADAALRLTAHVEEATARRLQVDLTGTGALAGREEEPLAAKIETVAARPGVDGRYRVDIAAPLPKSAAPGMSAKLSFIVHEAAEALVVPRKALGEGPGGTSRVEVKLADGKTESRAVKTGLAQGDEIQVLEGLEPGQVVVTPE